MSNVLVLITPEIKPRDERECETQTNIKNSEQKKKRKRLPVDSADGAFNDVDVQYRTRQMTIEWIKRALHPASPAPVLTNTCIRF